MQKIRFGTDGWRAIIADDFTVANVRRVSLGVARWMKEKKLDRAVIGYDTRFGGKLFARTAARVLASQGVVVYMDDAFVTTPVISLATRDWNAGVGIVITASHNPPSYNGYKLKSGAGGPLDDTSVKEIEALIPDQLPPDPWPEFEDLLTSGQIRMSALKEHYLEHIHRHFDIDRLRNLSSLMVFDSMFGAGMNIMKKLFPEATHLHDRPDPGFENIPPEPIARNLSSLMNLMSASRDKRIGLATDGDGDRIGLVDGDGRYLDSHHVLMLVLYYLAGIKKQKGKVVVSFATSEKVRRMAESYDLPFEYTPIGFKHIAPIMLREPVLLAGEEAGGIGCFGHIPERDGIWIALVLLEMVQETGKDLTDLIHMLHERFGTFVYDRYDLTLSESKKQEIIRLCRAGSMKKLGGRTIREHYQLDGYKYYFDEDSWLMIRPSGTEPVLRLYAQAPDETVLRSMLDEAKNEWTS